MKAGLQHSSLMFCSGVSQQAFAPEDDIVLTTMTQLAKVRGQQIADLVLTLSLRLEHRRWTPTRKRDELPGAEPKTSHGSRCRELSGKFIQASRLMRYKVLRPRACACADLARAEAWLQFV